MQNFKTAQIMGSARGAALSAAAIRNIPVFEYAPLRVKQAVVGFGRASKEQMSSTLAQMLGLPRHYLLIRQMHWVLLFVMHLPGFPNSEDCSCIVQ